MKDKVNHMITKINVQSKPNSMKFCLQCGQFEIKPCQQHNIISDTINKMVNVLRAF